MRSVSPERKARSSAWLKSGYGVAEIGLVSVEVMLQVYLLELYVSAGLSPILAGSALALAVVWDAVSDPLMGVVSDRTPASSAKGKRLWYVVAGTPFVALAFVFLFSPDLGSSESVLFWRLLLWYLILNTAITLVVVPYLALINDLAVDSADRGGFFGWRLVFSGGGLIVGLAIPPLVASLAKVDLDLGGSEALLENRSESAVWIALVGLGASALALSSVWRASGKAIAEVGSERGNGIADTFRSAAKSRGFRLVVGAFGFIALGRAVNGSLALIFYKGSLGFNDQQVAVALIGLSITVMLATPLWVVLGRRFGKRRLSLIGALLLTALTAISYPLMPPLAVWPVVFVVVFGGVVASSVVLLEVLFSDVIEADGIAGNLSLSGAYYGLWRTATKLARAAGLAVSGLFLWAIGYEEGGGAQAEGVYRSVAWAFGPGVAVFFGCGAYMLWRLRKSSVPQES